MYNKYIFINNNRRKKQKELLEKQNQEDLQLSLDMLTANMENGEIVKEKNEIKELSNINNSKDKDCDINSKINNDTNSQINRSAKSNRSKNLNKFVDDYVLVDIETTGLSPVKDDIIEIGAIKVENNKMVDTFNQLIKIDRSLPQFITNLTGITDEMLRTGRMPDEVFRDFVNFIGESVIIGHNVNFDLGFLSNKCKKYLDYNLANDYIDTLYLARRLVPNSINYKLGTLAHLFHISYEGAHRGLKDVEITYAVYNKLRSLKS